MAMLKGEIINGYKILKDFVVAGGMSKVTFAEKGGKEYFIKEFLSPKYPLPDGPGSEKVKAQRRKACETFEKHHRELNKKIGTKVSLGGNLVFAIDFFRSGTCYYKVTEKIDTASLSCEEISRLPLDKILLIVKSVCHSIRILHDLNIVHGDLKPDNILIKKTSLGFSGKLIDFDDSYFSGNPPTDRENLVGTPEYYSPEQAAYIMDEDEEIDGNTLTLKSDIFTLGIILCEYLTGKKPVLPSDCGSTWVCVEKGKLYSYAKSVPPEIKNLIDWMLRKNPNERPTINEVFELLKKTKVDESKPVDTPKIHVDSTKEPKVKIRSTFKKKESKEDTTESSSHIISSAETTGRKTGLRSKTWDVD